MAQLAADPPTAATDRPVETDPILYFAGGGLAPWALAAVITGLLVALCAAETVHARRHGWVRGAS